MPFLSTFFAAVFLAAATLPAGAAPLAAERWNKRIVVAFADKRGELLEWQISSLLADRQALAERDMLLLEVVGDEVTASYGRLPANLSADALRRAYAVASGTPFTVVFIGKDGGEKLRRTAPVPAKEILGLIDTMPMRQGEAKGN